MPCESANPYITAIVSATAKESVAFLDNNGGGAENKGGGGRRSVEVCRARSCRARCRHTKRIEREDTYLNCTLLTLLPFAFCLLPFVLFLLWKQQFTNQFQHQFIPSYSKQIVETTQSPMSDHHTVLQLNSLETLFPNLKKGEVLLHSETPVPGRPKYGQANLGYYVFIDQDLCEAPDRGFPIRLRHLR